MPLITFWQFTHYINTFVANILRYILVHVFVFAMISFGAASADIQKNDDLPDVYGIRHTIELDRHILTVGDVFEHAGLFKDIALFRTPKPGETGWLDVNNLVEALERNNILWFRPRLPRKILIKRTGKRINDKMLQSVLLEKLYDEKLLDKEDGEILEITFLNPLPPFYVSQSETGGLQVLSLNIGSNKDLVSAKVRARDLDEGQDFKILARLEKKVKLPVLKKGALQGVALRKRMLTHKIFKKSNIAQNVYMDIDNMLGLIARRDIESDTPIYKNDLEIKKTVKTNDIVMVEYNLAGLAIRAKATALENGTINEIIQVRNTRSGQILKVKIIDNGVVELTQ